ncbi:unnamed protein product [Closterium sp. NIES-54]
MDELDDMEDSWLTPRHVAAPYGPVAAPFGLSPPFSGPIAALPRSCRRPFAASSPPFSGLVSAPQRPRRRPSVASLLPLVAPSPPFAALPPFLGPSAALPGPVEQPSRRHRRAAEQPLPLCRRAAEPPRHRSRDAAVPAVAALSLLACLGPPHLPGKSSASATALPYPAALYASLLLSWSPSCDRADGLSLFDLTSGASPAPAADADATVRSQWATRDVAARLAVRHHLPTAERAHFSEYKSAKTLYDAVVARYSSPATAALSRLFLPYLFPDLAAFPTVADLITHLRTSDIRYRAALPAEICAKNPPPPYVHHPLLHSHPAP